jgi:hypothetical protein
LLRLFCILLLLPNFSYGSAWLVKPGGYKINSELDFNEYRSIETSNNQSALIKYHTVFLKIEAEKGLTTNFSLGYNLVTENNYYSLYQSSEGDFIETKGQITSLPTQYKSQNINLKTNLYSDDLNILSHQISFEHFRKDYVGEKNSRGNFNIQNQLMFGKTFKYKERYHFAELKLGYQKALGAYDDAVKLEISLGFTKNDKMSYIIQALNYYQLKHTDPITLREIDLNNHYKETNLKFFVVRKIKD